MEQEDGERITGRDCEVTIGLVCVYVATAVRGGHYPDRRWRGGLQTPAIGG